MGKLFIIAALLLVNVVIDFENRNRIEDAKKEAADFGYELVY